MAFPVTLNGRTYTLTDFEGTNYVDGLPDAFEDFVTQAGQIYSTTSTTSNSIGTGSKTFTVEASKPYQVGTPLRIADTAAVSTNWIDGIVTAYSGTTLTVDAVAYAGSGTKTAWSINIGGGPIAYTGTLPIAQGGTGATTAAAAQTNLDVYSKADADSRFLNVSGEASDVVITGDLTVDTDTLYVDSANNNVGIGTSSPVFSTGGGVEVSHASSANLRLNSDAGGAAEIRHGTALTIETRTEEPVIIGTNSSEAMRISGGNLLVGTTSTTLYAGDQGEGFAYRAGNELTVARSGAAPVTFVRQSNDGTIVNFKKDTANVGSIGIAQSGDRIYLSGGGEAVGLDNGGNEFLPMTTAGADNTGAIDLGKSSSRFKDLYLSGGVYLGGTGSANKLDRYEEGTWNLTCTAFTATSSNAFYRVIGDVCYAWFNVVGVSNLNSNAVRINLPFTSAYGAGFGSAGSVFANFNNLSPTSCWVGNSASVVDFYNSVSTNSQYTQFGGGNIYGANAANFAMYGQFQYRIP